MCVRRPRTQPAQRSHVDDFGFTRSRGFPALPPHPLQGLARHQEWDERVREISGGMTILSVVKGQWLHPSGELFAEPMIPVRLIATKVALEDIITFTMDFYEQEAVMAYHISDQIIVRHR